MCSRVQVLCEEPVMKCQHSERTRPIEEIASVVVQHCHSCRESKTNKYTDTIEKSQSVYLCYFQQNRYFLFFPKLSTTATQQWYEMRHSVFFMYEMLMINDNSHNDISFYNLSPKIYKRNDEYKWITWLLISMSHIFAKMSERRDQQNSEICVRR